ncbi:MAG: 3-phosphoserine/phosphohydroxythreonine transaminase [Candidatus Hydrogenedentes bacterium]|nr:3-phosphoserine/phosphohydroxythreonine transaminase [Candidatus Hydrogenedentota bacterium]
MEQRVHNFSAGPAGLPLAALEEAQRDLLAYPGAGASIMEISHRSKTFEAVLQSAKSNIVQLLNVPSNYKVLFLQGGASMQFSQVPINFLRGTGKSADYIITGAWGSKAIKEAKKEGAARAAWSGKEQGFNRVPAQSELDLDANAAYCHFTTNETIEGVQFQAEPNVGGVPLVCDMSSDFLCRPFDVSKYAFIYAGAQKNIGPAGVVVVIVREDMLARVPEGLPSMLDYKLIAENDSLYNTPPCFAIYMVMLVTKWLASDIGGLAKMEAINNQKAKLLYEAIDASGGYYRGHAKPDCRSLMNVTWRLPSEELEAKFVKEAKAAGMDGLKGHRSVGGIRASIYNAMTVEGCNALASFMADFKSKNG